MEKLPMSRNKMTLRCSEFTEGKNIYFRKCNFLWFCFLLHQLIIMSLYLVTAFISPFDSTLVYFLLYIFKLIVIIEPWTLFLSEASEWPCCWRDANDVALLCKPPLMDI